MQDYNRFLALFPCVIGHVLFFKPSADTTKQFLCLVDGQLVDLNTRRSHESLLKWWDILEESGLKTSHCRSTPLNYIKVNETDDLSLADVQSAVIRDGAENVSIASFRLTR